MAVQKSTVKLPQIQQFWKDMANKETRDALKIEQSFMQLKLNGEQELSNLKYAVPTKKQRLAKLQEDALDKPCFKAIADLSIEIEADEYRFVKYVEVYKNMFGEDPKFV